MTKNDLKIKLENKGFPTGSFSLEGGLPNESYCLNKNGKIWEVYYSERGNKSGLKEFKDESEACLYMYNLLNKSIK